MEARFIATQYGTYDKIQWIGINESGIQPLCDKVLILPDQAVAKTQGGILMPDSVRDNSGAAATTGVMVARGPQAFAWDSSRRVQWTGDMPQPGCRVFFQKYAGQEYTGRDGLLYRLMDYESIAGMELSVDDRTEI